MADSDSKAERDARLAAALRANLRRRKAYAPAPDAAVSGDDPAADAPPADPQRPIA